MAFFSKPEVVILKESRDVEKYLEKLEDLSGKVSGKLKEEIEQEIYIARAGKMGEDAILYELKNSGIDMIVLHDIYIACGEQNAQIDYYVVTPKMNFILECKNLFGNIEINSKGEFVRTIHYGKWNKKIEGIYSPVTQNERHMDVLRNKEQEGRGAAARFLINRSFEDVNKSLVVLANAKTVVNDRYAKKEVKQKIVRADQLIAVMKQMIRESRQSASSKKAMRETAERVLAWNVEERKDYFAKYQKLYDEYLKEEAQKEEAKRKENAGKEVREEKAADSQEVILCPQCGGSLVKRNGRYGEFYGCSNYPKCKYTLKIKKTGEV
ncbi:topoisomerase DNA-binding C4 zinc finger domain-containing protein [Lachnospiraceae bacterium 46-15]